MLRIAVCDDSESQLRETVEVLKRFSEGRSLDFSVSPFSSVDGFFVEADPARFDIVFMDIEFAGKPLGIEAVERINGMAPNCQVVYLTDYLQYSVDVCHTGYVWFVLKSQFEDRLAEIFEKLARIEEVRRCSIVITTTDGVVVKLPCQAIFFLERRRRVTHIVTANGEYVVRDKLEDILDKLPKLTFAYCHSSVVANMPQILEIHVAELVFPDGVTAPMSRRYARRFRDRYFDWAEQWTV